ncbi:HD domain-containing protein [Listeria costaricensis]|uniref:HD domain-containing protein n=1 Tax=Listeria costaricensis TaxID=2026604 RepID=UPI000C069B56|nr:HD domain-containing protein [Listeria costaricensis]
MYEKAKAYARAAHEGQKRKITGEIYFSHPLNVARILRQAGFSEDVVIAGLLHDVVEDTVVTGAEIEQEFGPHVAALVLSHTENKALSWEERKAHTIETVRTGSLEEKALIVADKYDNLSSIRYAMSSEGHAVWQHFKRGYDLQKWYYTGVAKAMRYGVDPRALPAYFDAYERMVQTVFKK